MPLLRGPAPGPPAGGRLTGRWRYNGLAGRGIAVSYGHGMTEPAAPAPTLRGRVSPPPAAHRAPAPPPHRAPPPAPVPPRAAPPPGSGGVRVLCSCGDVFTFDGEEADCPTCGRRAGWPTMGVVEREMRSDLEELLNAHKRGDDVD